MAASAPKPKFVVNENGERSAVVLSIRDYEKLLDAWEEVVDAADFVAARESADSFVSTDELRRRVFRQA